MTTEIGPYRMKQKCSFVQREACGDLGHSTAILKQWLETIYREQSNKYERAALCSKTALEAVREKRAARLWHHHLPVSDTPGNSDKKESDLNIEAQKEGGLPLGTFTAAHYARLGLQGPFPSSTVGAAVTLRWGRREEWEATG